MKTSIVRKNNNKYLTSAVYLKSLGLVENLNDFSKINLKAEWRIWSKCFGKVLVINGVSSVGKTTLSKYLDKFGFNRISTDDVSDQYLFEDIMSIIPHEILHAQKALINKEDIFKILSDIKVNKSKYSYTQIQVINNLEIIIPTIKDLLLDRSLVEINDRMYNEAKQFIFSGQNVVIDTVITEQYQIDLFSYCFRYYPFSMVLLYSSLEENLKKCFVRNELSFKNDVLDFRKPGLIIDQYCSIYKFVSRDTVTLIDKVLGKVNKVTTQDILKQAIYHTYKLSDYIDTTPESYTKWVQRVSLSVEKASNIMMLLSDNNDIAVVPTITFDYVIDSACLGSGALITYDLEEY
jgi:hypothetical protein